MRAAHRAHPLPPPAAAPAGHELPAPLPLVLTRVRLRARLRAAWLRHLWRDGPRQAGAQAVAQTVADIELDAVLEDRDAPELETAWLARDEGAGELRAVLGPIEAALAADGESRLARLCRTFALTEHEVDALQLCVALALDPQLARAFAYLHDDARRGHVSAELTARLFGHGRASLLGAGSALHRWELLAEREVAPGEARLRECDPAVLSFLLGGDELDAELIAAARPVRPRPPLPGWPLEEPAALLRRLLAGPRPEQVRYQIAGAPGSGRRTLAAALAARLGLAALAVDAEAADWPRLFHRAQRRAWLDHCALVWHGEAGLRRPWPAEPPWFPLQFAITESPDPLPPAEGLVDRLLEMPAPSLDERLALWRQAVPASAGWQRGALEGLASRHRSGVGQIAAAARQRIDGPAEAEALVRESARRQLGDLAQRLDCPFAWDDLVVPPALQSALEDLVFEAGDRIAFWERPEARRLFPQGRGLIGLFSGPPGTGKTMAAQVVARSLEVDLFRIDLSTVVSKWVGETSRNLERVLARAADLDLVLLFDEADALFGQRTEVQDAHDRYANTDTNHLLQAIESYRGVALLASNRRGDIDPAFMRRLRYVLHFPAPDAGLRARLWRRLVGELAGHECAEELAAELAELADSLELAGGQIKYAVLGGLFAARQARAPLRMEHLMVGVERELAKEGRAPSARLRDRWGRHG
jgi:hypothetical protein